MNSTMNTALELTGFKNRPAGMIRKINRPAVTQHGRTTSLFIVAEVTESDDLEVTVSAETDALLDAAEEVRMVAELEGATGHVYLRSTRI